MFNALATLPEGATSPTGSRFSRDSSEGERVLRSEYRWNGWDADWSISAEAAYNFIDATSTFEVLDANGGYHVIDIPGASSRVEEKRGESILSYSRSLSDDVVSAGERRDGVQRAEPGRRPGPDAKLLAAQGCGGGGVEPDVEWEYNFKLQRKVGQLNFFDFLASVDVENNNANGANPELVPPQSWLAQVEAIRSLGPYGKIKFNVEYEDITDYVEQIPLGPLVEAPGNLPDAATRLQLTFDASLLLDGIGIPGGKLDTFITWRDTSMIDPLFGHRAAAQRQSLLLERGLPPGRSEHALDLGHVSRKTRARTISTGWTTRNVSTGRGRLAWCSWNTRTSSA